MSLSKRFLVSGRVQGVFFRASTQERARDLGLKGWVRNLPDGRVEVMAAGSPGALQQLENWLWQGPDRADVDEVEVVDAPDSDTKRQDDFVVHRER
jgi:acylphosphatase